MLKYVSPAGVDARFHRPSDLMMVPTLIAISIIVFNIIQLPPGDYLTTHIANSGPGRGAAPSRRSSSCRRIRLDKPLIEQYLDWARSACCTAISAIRSSSTCRSPR